MAESTAPTRQHWLLLLCLGVIWGSSFMGVSLALDGLTPLQLAATRVTVAAVVLCVYALLTGRERPGKGTGQRIWLHIIAFAIFSNALPFSLLGWGQIHVTSGFAGVSMAVVPLLLVPMAHFFVVGERMTVLKSLGFLIGFAGALVLIGPGAFASSGAEMENLARLACIGAATCYAIGAIAIRTAPPTGQIAFAASALAIAAALITPLAILIDGFPNFGADRSTIAILYLSAIPTALATIIMVHIIRAAGPSFISLVNYQVPVWSVIFGAFLLGEVVPASLYLALALILLGIVISRSGARFVRA